jgi:two-component system chemotaxis response regulator CheB
MKIVLINNNMEITKAFEEVVKTDFNLILKSDYYLKHTDFDKFMYPFIKEFYFINIDLIEPKDILRLNKKEVKLATDKVVFLSDKNINYYNVFKYDKNELKTESGYRKFVNRLAEYIEKRKKLCVKTNINLFNKNYNDEILETLVPYENNKTYVLKKIITVGSSIGGLTIIEEIVSNLKKGNYPPILITQHILSSFADGIVTRLKKVNDNFDYMLVHGKEELKNNTIYFSNGSDHMVVKKEGSEVFADILSTKKTINKHIPSINALFRSIANIFGNKALGIILTGMGKDGITGIGELYVTGAETIAQNKESSVVHGMAGIAIEEGYINEELRVNEIVDKINKFSGAY